MIALVDTSVWSLALRRKSRSSLSIDQLKHVRILERFIDEARVALLGVVRQEILSGIKERNHFVRLRDLLQGFPDVPLEGADYERAAEMSNLCRSHGIAGSSTDFLICSVAERREWTIYSLDPDFERYSKYLDINLLH
jgi:predicted nucleic acid-binding protein